MQREVLVELRQTEEALERGAAHVADVAESHVVLDQGEDLRGLFVREAQPVEDGSGDLFSSFNVAVEADAVAGLCGIGRRKRRGLADIVQQHAPGERHRGSGLQMLEQHQRMHPHIAFGMVLRRLLYAFERGRLG